MARRIENDEDVKAIKKIADEVYSIIRAMPEPADAGTIVAIVCVKLLIDIHGPEASETKLKQLFRDLQSAAVPMFNSRVAVQ